MWRVSPAVARIAKNKTKHNMPCSCTCEWRQIACREDQTHVDVLESGCTYTFTLIRKGNVLNDLWTADRNKLSLSHDYTYPSKPHIESHKLLGFILTEKTT